MKYLRHTPLAGWVMICLLMGALLVSALVVGGSSNAIPSTGVPDRRAAITDVNTLRYRLADVNRVATPPASGLNAWAAETSRLATEMADRRELEGAPTGDGMLQVLRTMAKDAENLSKVDPSDTSAVRAGVALLLADGDALAAVLTGVPAGPVIPVPSDELPVIESGRGDELPESELPEADPGRLPAVPAVPVNPARPGEVAVPIVPADPAAQTQPGGEE